MGIVVPSDPYIFLVKDQSLSIFISSLAYSWMMQRVSLNYPPLFLLLFDKAVGSIRVKILSLLVFFYFLWLSSNQKWSQLLPSKYAIGYSNELARAFLHRQLFLLIQPSPKFSMLQDPYDPSLNQLFALHDASLYHNHYYLYFSPIVSLIFLIPLRIITFHYFSEYLLCAILAFATVIVATEAALKYAKMNKIQIGLKAKIFLLVSSTFLSALPVILSRVAVYELEIVCGGFFLSLAILQLVSNPNFAQWHNMECLRLGLLLSITVATRAPHCIFAIIVTIYFLKDRLINGTEFKLKFYSILNFFFFPASILAALLTYNYLRFGTLFEFGTHFMLAGFDPQKTLIFSYHFLPVGIFQYLFTIPRISTSFPFFFLQTNYLTFPRSIFYDFEPVLGFLAMPVMILASSHFFSKSRRFPDKTSFQLKQIFIYSGVGEIIFLSFNLGSTLRYLGDFMIFFVVLIAPTLLGTKNNHTLSLNTLVCLAFCYTVLELFFLSFTGYTNWLQAFHPAEWKTFSDICNWPIQLVQHVFRT